MTFAGARVRFANFHPILNDVGVTQQQRQVLLALLEYSPKEPRQISDICCLAKPCLIGILARMGKLGLVQRERFPNDQHRSRRTVSASN